MTNFLTDGNARMKSVVEEAGGWTKLKGSHFVFGVVVPSFGILVTVASAVLYLVK